MSIREDERSKVVPPIIAKSLLPDMEVNVATKDLLLFNSNHHYAHFLFNTHHSLLETAPYGVLHVATTV
jgi:hypothetical protein